MNILLSINSNIDNLQIGKILHWSSHLLNIQFNLNYSLHNHFLFLDKYKLIFLYFWKHLFYILSEVQLITCCWYNCPYFNILEYFRTLYIFCPVWACSVWEWLTKPSITKSALSLNEHKFMVLCVLCVCNCTHGVQPVGLQKPFH